MNVILDLDKSYLDKFQELADQDRRSRKNFMESVLINYLNGNPPTMERQNGSHETTNSVNSKVEEKIKQYEEELLTLGAGTIAAQRRTFIKNELSALRRLL